MRGRRARLLILAAIAFVGVAALFLAGSMRHTVRLSAADIQSQLESKFPQEKHELIFTARFSDPTVAIDPGTGHVTLGISAAVSALGMDAVTSRADVEGAVRYEASTGELFLDSPVVNVREFEMAGLPEKDKKTARKLAEEALREYLAKIPIYRLKRQDAKLFSARRVLKSVRVRDGELEIELGF